MVKRDLHWGSARISQRRLGFRSRANRKAAVVTLIIAGALCSGVAMAQTPSLIVSDASAAPGSEVQISVTLHSSGVQVVVTESTLTFDNTNVTLNLTASGNPDCAVNPALEIDNAATGFTLQPAQCTGSACTGVKALVQTLNDTDVIPDGSVLYTCNVNVAATASGTSIVTISDVGVDDSSGNVYVGTGVNGTITITGSPASTGCHIGREQGAATTWLLGIPVLALMIARRRRVCPRLSTGGRVSG